MDRVFNFFDRRNGVVDGICRLDDLGEVSISRPINGRKDPSVAPPCPHGGIISHPLRSRPGGPGTKTNPPRIIRPVATKQATFCHARRPGGSAELSIRGRARRFDTGRAGLRSPLRDGGVFGMVVKMRQAGYSSPQFVRTRRSKSSSYNAARSSASGPWPCSSVSIEAATSPGVSIVIHVQFPEARRHIRDASPCTRRCGRAASRSW